MTWSEIDPPVPRSSGKAPVKVSMSRPPRSSLPAQCSVIVSAQMAADLGWDTETPLKVWMGEGSERGWAMIRKNGEGPFRARDKRGSLSIRLGEISALGTEPRKAQPAEHEIKNDALYVRLFVPRAPSAPRDVTADIVGGKG